MRYTGPLSHSPLSSYNPERLLSHLLQGLERCFIVAALVLFTGAFNIFLFGDEERVMEGDPRAQLIFFAIYAIAFGLVLLRHSTFLRHLFAEKYLLLLVTLAVLSFVWSAVPDLTIRRTVALLGTTLFSIYIASRFSLKQLLQLIGWTCIVIVVSSIVVALLMPSDGVMQEIHIGAWRGVFDHKNTLGRMMTFSAVVFVLLYINRAMRRWVSVLGLLMALLAMFMAQSATAIVVLVGTLLILPLLQVLRWRSNVAIIIAILIILLGGFAVTYVWANTEEVLSSLGRDVTLTGRTELWQLSFEAVLARPWLGYGYDGFWVGWNSESAHIWVRVFWEPPHAHNGWLELLLSLGAVGLTLFIASLVVALSHSIRYLRSKSADCVFWPLMFFTFLMLVNITEATFLGSRNIFWVVQVAVTLQVIVGLNKLSRLSTVKEATEHSAY
jgi:exopolysaccharide production protein ExoQ